MKKGIESHKTLSENFYKFNHETQEGWFENPNGQVLKTLQEDYRFQEEGGARRQLRYARWWGKKDQLKNRPTGHYTQIQDLIRHKKNEHICVIIADENGLTLKWDGDGAYVERDNKHRIYFNPWPQHVFILRPYGDMVHTHFCENEDHLGSTLFYYQITTTPAKFLQAIKAMHSTKHATTDIRGNVYEW